MKTKFDIEIKDSEKISGGYIMTTEPMTKKQVIAFMTGLGRELMKNNRNLGRVSIPHGKLIWKILKMPKRNCMSVDML